MRKDRSRTAILTVSKAAMILGFIMLVMSGCIPIGPTRFPEPSPSFAPRKEYNSSLETVWKTVHDVLEDNRIAVATSNKNDGRITTEYIAGQDQLMVLSPMGTRYRYSIRISSADGKSTRINIASYLESSTGSYQTWHDVTNENKGIISRLENWLYEQIEKGLLTKATSAPDLNEQVTKPKQRDPSSIQSSLVPGRVLESFVDPTNAQIVFAISDSQPPSGQYLLRSEDGGKTWNKVTAPNGSIVSRYGRQEVADFFVRVGPASSPRLTITYAALDAVWRTEANLKWKKYSGPKGLIVGQLLPTADLNRFFAIAGKAGQKSNLLYRTDNGAAAWVEVNKQLPFECNLLLSICEITVSPDGKILSGEGYVSRDGGKTWNRNNAKTGEY